MSLKIPSPRNYHNQDQGHSFYSYFIVFLNKLSYHRLFLHLIQSHGNYKFGKPTISSEKFIRPVLFLPYHSPDGMGECVLT